MKVLNFLSKRLLMAIYILFITAIAFAFSSCASDKTASDFVSSEKETITDINVIGEGNTEFALKVVDKNGKSEAFTVKTDETTVGAALKSLGLIEGEEGAYGIYVKKVNGITADYDIDKTYWAFYIDGVYAQAGADQTDIESGVTYEFRVEKMS